MELNQVRVNVSKQWIEQRQSNVLIPSSYIWLLRRIHFLLEFFHSAPRAATSSKESLEGPSAMFDAEFTLETHGTNCKRCSRSKYKCTKDLEVWFVDPALIKKIEQPCYQHEWRCTSTWCRRKKRCSPSQLEESPAGVSYHLWARHHWSLGCRKRLWHIFLIRLPVLHQSRLPFQMNHHLPRSHQWRSARLQDFQRWPFGAFQPRGATSWALGASECNLIATDMQEGHMGGD